MDRLWKRLESFELLALAVGLEPTMGRTPTG